MLDVVIYSRGKPWAVEWLNAIAQGLSRHGIPATFEDADTPRDCDLAVFWGHGEPAIIARQRAAAKHTLVAECAYLDDRLKWVSLGFDGLNGRADFVNDGIDGDRWDRHFAHLMTDDWKAPGEGDVALICGQVAGDQALAHVDINAWYALAVKHLRGAYRRVVFRPHPKGGNPPHLPEGVEVSTLSLAEDLDRAAVAVTFSSNSGVDAVLAGVPVIACDIGSMAWDVAAHTFDAPLRRPDRLVWAHRLAHCQWLPSEVQSGAAWDHLKRKFDHAL